MKNLKTIFILLFIFTFFNCKSSEDNSTTPIEQNVEAVLDISTIANLSDGADITSLVDFGDGGNAANYTTEAIIGDEITYNIKTSSAQTTIWIKQIRFSDGNFDFWSSGLDPVYLPNIPGAAQGEEMIAGFTVNERASEDDEVKFDILVNLVNNGVKDDSKTFTIDPKIKIKRRR